VTVGASVVVFGRYRTSPLYAPSARRLGLAAAMHVGERNLGVLSIALWR